MWIELDLNYHMLVAQHQSYLDAEKDNTNKSDQLIHPWKIPWNVWDTEKSWIILVLTRSFVQDCNRSVFHFYTLKHTPSSKNNLVTNVC